MLSVKKLIIQLGDDLSNMGKRLKAAKDNQCSESTKSISLGKESHVTKEKPKKIVFDDEGNPMTPQTEDVPTITNHNPQSNSKKRKNKDKIINQNEKIVLEDSDDNPKKNKKLSNTTEEDGIKEEDIDTFCDEIEDEDNKQYENWVKLIEEKLSSNKKKS